MMQAARERGEEVWWRTGCEIKVPGVCQPKIKEQIAAESLSFWTYLMARSALNSAINAAFTLFEGATLSLLMEHSGDYGLQRYRINLVLLSKTKGTMAYRGIGLI